MHAEGGKKKKIMRIWRTIIHPVFEKPEYSLDNLYFTNHSSNPRNDKNKRGYSYAPRLGVSTSVTAGTTASSGPVHLTVWRKGFELLLVSEAQALLPSRVSEPGAPPAPAGPTRQPGAGREGTQTFAFPAHCSGAFVRFCPVVFQQYVFSRLTGSAGSPLHKSRSPHVRWGPTGTESRAILFSRQNASMQTYHTLWHYIQHYPISRTD